MSHIWIRDRTAQLLYNGGSRNSSLQTSRIPRPHSQFVVLDYTIYMMDYLPRECPGVEVVYLVLWDVNISAFRRQCSGERARLPHCKPRLSPRYPFVVFISSLCVFYRYLKLQHLVDDLATNYIPSSNSRPMLPAWPRHPIPFPDSPTLYLVLWGRPVKT